MPPQGQLRESKYARREIHPHNIKLGLANGRNVPPAAHAPSSWFPFSFKIFNDFSLATSTGIEPVINSRENVRQKAAHDYGDASRQSCGHPEDYRYVGVCMPRAKELKVELKTHPRCKYCRNDAPQLPSRQAGSGF